MATNIKELLSMRQLTVREPSSTRERERETETKGEGGAGVLQYPELAQVHTFLVILWRMRQR